MVANLGETVSLREGFVAELTDAALEEVARHRVGGTSIEQELGLWKTLSQVVAGYMSRLRCGEGVARTRRQCEDFLAELAEAAYEVALVHGFRGPFPDVQLGLWRTLRQVVREGRAGRAVLSLALSSRRHSRLDRADLWTDGASVVVQTGGSSTRR